jgi:hypothetical protein
MWGDLYGAEDDWLRYHLPRLYEVELRAIEASSRAVRGGADFVEIF